MNAPYHPITTDEAVALLRTDFVSFSIQAFSILNPGIVYYHAPFIDVIASKLEAVRLGHIKRLIINVPPRSLKSHLASICFPAWLLAQNATLRIIDVSYSQDLAENLARACLTLMESDFFQQLFPGTRLSSSKRSVAEFLTSMQGFRLATSVGGTLTGKGGDVILIDDPMKPEEALSITALEKVISWYRSTLLSRLNDKHTGAIVIIMQRLHENDLVGHVLKQEGWEVVSFPAIAETEDTFVFDTPAGQRSFTRSPGGVLHPERLSLAVLEETKRDIGEYMFASQYQQRPAPLGGGIVKLEWFRSYGPNDLPDEFDEIIQSWDTANKGKEMSDYSVCTTWGRKGKNLFLLDVWRKQVDFPDLVRAVFELKKRLNATLLLIEDAASGVQLGQQLKEQEGFYSYQLIKPVGDKIVRLSTQSPVIENGHVYVPREAHWRDAYLQEMTTFPASRYADQVDSTTQALAYLTSKNNIACAGLMDYMEAEARKSGWSGPSWRDKA